jgi:hypothetical protein
VDIDAPDHYGGRLAAHRRPFLGERPPRVDGVARMHCARELPVQPLPCGHRGNRHIHRTETDCHRHHQRRRGDPAGTARGVDGEGREIARDGGEQRDLRFGDGAATGSPLAAKGKVVERDRLQVGIEYIARTRLRSRALPYGNSNREDYCRI